MRRNRHRLENQEEERVVEVTGRPEPHRKPEQEPGRSLDGRGEASGEAATADPMRIGEIQVREPRCRCRLRREGQTTYTEERD